MKRNTLAPEQVQERLLAIMDQKHHWAWAHFTGNSLGKEQLKIHFQQEYAVYVRDFPVYLARIHGQNPPPTVRRMLAENIYEEDTGGLSFGRSHPELFHEMMQGLGYDSLEFERVKLLPASTAYRRWLEQVSGSGDWVVGAAALAIFVEGSIKDRKEILEPSKPKTQEEIETYVRQHPLVRYHGLSADHLDLIRAHQKVEAGHRQDAYAMVVEHATTAKQQQAVLACLKKALGLWVRYRDGVAKACGLKRR
ncbi:MAG: TenA family transcriptional regulator [Nitrospiraceae bacterium]